MSWPSLQALRSISRISEWVAMMKVKKNRRSKGNRDRWSPSHSSRRTPLFRKRDLTFLERLNRVLGRRRSSARRGTLVRLPLPRRHRFTLVNVDDRYGRQISRPESRGAGKDDDGVGVGIGSVAAGRRAVGTTDFRIPCIPTDEPANRRQASRPLYLTVPSTIVQVLQPLAIRVAYILFSLQPVCTHFIISLNTVSFLIIHNVQNFT